MQNKTMTEPPLLDMTVSSIISKAKKQEVLRILRAKGYLQYFDDGINITPSDFLETNKKIPFAWLLNAYCLNTDPSGQDGLSHLKENHVFTLETMAANGTEPFLEVEEMNGNQRNVLFSNTFATTTMKELQKSRIECNRRNVSKAELYEIIKAIFPDYCPAHGCLAPIRAAHRNWYIIILLLACHNHKENYFPISSEECMFILYDFRKKKRHVLCRRGQQKVEEVQSSTDDDYEDEQTKENIDNLKAQIETLQTKLTQSEKLATPSKIYVSKPIVPTVANPARVRPFAKSNKIPPVTNPTNVSTVANTKCATPDCTENAVRDGLCNNCLKKRQITDKKISDLEFKETTNYMNTYLCRMCYIPSDKPCTTCMDCLQSHCESCREKHLAVCPVRKDKCPVCTMVTELDVVCFLCDARVCTETCLNQHLCTSSSVGEQSAERTRRAEDMPSLKYRDNSCWRHAVAQMTAQTLADMVCKRAVDTCSYAMRASVQLATLLVRLRTQRVRVTTAQKKEIALRADAAEIELFDKAPLLDEKEQNDASDGFNSLIEFLQNDNVMCNHCTNFKLFLSNTSYCLTCGEITEPEGVTTEAYAWVLKIVPQDRVHLSKLLEDFCQPQVLLGYRRPPTSCHPEQKYVFQRYMLTEAPVHLYIRINRFTEIGKKLDTKVDFPMVLDLSPYMFRGSNTEHSKLILIGVIWHSGSAGSGHYTTTTWIPQIKDWVYFDDIPSETTLETGKWWESRQSEKKQIVTALLYSRSVTNNENQNEPCETTACEHGK
jgi:hypothetical protein